MKKVGILDNDEKEALEGQQYAPNRFFTPLQDDDNNWILPLDQITNCKNIKFWWVKHLPLIEYKPTKMDKTLIPDVLALSGLFLFTGAEVGIENTILEIISKFGVVAVLWYWLQNMTYNFVILETETQSLNIALSYMKTIFIELGYTAEIVE